MLENASQHIACDFHASQVCSITACSPGHTLRCCAPAMGRSEGAAMPQNRVRCAAIES